MVGMVNMTVHILINDQSDQSDQSSIWTKFEVSFDTLQPNGRVGRVPRVKKVEEFSQVGGFEVVKIGDGPSWDQARWTRHTIVKYKNNMPNPKYTSFSLLVAFKSIAQTSVTSWVSMSS